MLSKPTIRLALWLALFAVLINALAPSVSHALTFARTQMQANVHTPDVCSADPAALTLAMHHMQAAPEGKHDSAGMMEDCAYCLVHGGSYGLLPFATAPALFGSHSVRPFLFYRAPRPLLALTAAPPRGPPVPA